MKRFPIERLIVIFVLLTVLCHLIFISFEKTRGIRLFDSVHNGFGLLSTHLVVRASISFTLYLRVLCKGRCLLNVHFFTFNKESIVFVILLIVAIEEMILGLVVRFLSIVLLLFLVNLIYGIGVLLDASTALSLIARLEIIIDTHLFDRDRITFQLSTRQPSCLGPIYRLLIVISRYFLEFQCSLLVGFSQSSINNPIIVYCTSHIGCCCIALNPNDLSILLHFIILLSLCLL